MLHIVTVPGGNGVTISIPFNSGDNAALAESLLVELKGSPPGERNIVTASDGVTGANPADVNELVADTSGSVSVPGGFQYLIGDYKLNGSDAYPANSFIASGTLDGAVIDDENAFTTYNAGSGRVSIVAGGNINIDSASNASGGGVVTLDGPGTDSADVAGGNWKITTGTGPGSFTLGAGDDTVLAYGTDTITGGTGTALIGLSGDNNVVHGGQGKETIAAAGANDVVDAGAGAVTVFAQGSSTTINGTTAEVLVVDSTGGNTITGATGGIVAFGASVGSLYNAPDNYFLFTSGGGDDTLDAAAGTKGPVVFGSPDAVIHINSAVGAFVVGGAGDETVDASGTSKSVTFFASTGSVDMIGGSAANFFCASSGPTTMSGGTGNLYEFIDGHAGSTNTITDFTTSDSLYLSGYGLGADSGIVSETVTNGVLDMKLNDGTNIIFKNISNASMLDGKIHHI